jgi:chromate transporter
MRFLFWSKSKSSFWETLWVFLQLGFTCFGGPVAHMGFFRETFVVRRKWLDEKTLADLISLCQFLPGPASSQTGFAIGLYRGGLLGGVAAWIGFTLPSAVFMTAFAYGVHSLGSGWESGSESAHWLNGLKIAVVAVVAQALLGMSKSLCPDRLRATLAILAAAFLLAFPMNLGPVIVLAVGGVIGLLLRLPSPASSEKAKGKKLTQFPSWIGWASGILFAALLGSAVWGRGWIDAQLWVLFSKFYQVGSLVFGGGHVVLPLIQQEVVTNSGWVTEDAFLAGYGVAQAVPGPLFTFSSYLGGVAGAEWTGGVWLGALVATIGIFLPGLILVVAIFPFWNQLRKQTAIQSALAGMNAAVVGVLGAALYHPVWTKAIHDPRQLAFGLVLFVGLYFWKTAPWMLIALSAAGGYLLKI